MKNINKLLFLLTCSIFSSYALADSGGIITPNYDDTSYSIKNISGVPVYPSFSINNDAYSADSIHGWLESGKVRLYTPADAYWLSIGIKDNTPVSVAVFDSKKNKYIPCSKTEPVKGKRFFFYNSNGVCLERRGNEITKNTIKKITIQEE